MAESKRNGGTGEVAKQASGALAEGAAAVQEQALAFVGGLVGEAAKTAVARAEITHKLALTVAETAGMQQRVFQEPLGAYLGLFFAPLYGSRVELRRPARESGGDLPVEGYDELSVEEVGEKLKDLSAEETKKVRAYEKRHKNRGVLIERFDRSLV